MNKKFVLIIVLVLPFVCVSCCMSLVFATYGRWEYLSFKHKDEFLDDFDNVSDGCSYWIEKDEIEKIKVMKYSERKAEVFVRTKTGISYLVEFTRENKNSDWTWESNDVCHFEVLNGGNSDTLYWYD